MTLRKLALAGCTALGLMAAADAQAAPFTIGFSSPTGPDGQVVFTIKGETGAGTVLLHNYSESEEESTGPDFFMTTFTDPAAAFAVGQTTQTGGPDGSTTYAATLSLSNPLLSYTVTETGINPSTTDRTGYRLAFRLLETVYGGMRPNEFSVDGAELVLLGGITALVEPSVTVSGLSLAPVPLPGTLPLFGAALLALAGAATLGRRTRGTQPTAA